MILSVLIGNEKLAERINTIEKDNLNLTDKIQYMSMDYETLQKDTERLSERIHIVEIDHQNQLKSYKVAGRTSLPKDNLHATQIIFNDEKLSLVEKLGIIYVE